MELKAMANGTKAFKKKSQDGKITVYLGKRDFIEHFQNDMEPIDGMILVDDELLMKGQKVFVTLTAGFRYGSADLEFMGIACKKELLTLTKQIYPPTEEDQVKELSDLQDKLKKKLGDKAYPFTFKIPLNSPTSVFLQPEDNDTRKPCGIDYVVRSFVAVNVEDGPKPKDSVRLIVRKFTHLTEDKENKKKPKAEVTKEYGGATGPLHMEIALNKEIYYHGEQVLVDVKIYNNSCKTVKKMKATVIQVAHVCMFGSDTYVTEVAKCEIGGSEYFPIQPGHEFVTKVSLSPILENNRDKEGLALDGKLKYQDTNLASSTLMSPGVKNEDLGIVVEYKVAVHLTLSGVLTGDLVGEVPFTLTHAKHVIPHHGDENTVVAGDYVQLSEVGGFNQLEDELVFEDFSRLLVNDKKHREHN